MRNKKHKISQQWYKHNLFKPLKTWPKRAKRALKSGILGAKMQEIGA
jgi:hypothetical protein